MARNADHIRIRAPFHQLRRIFGRAVVQAEGRVFSQQFFRLLAQSPFRNAERFQHKDFHDQSFSFSEKYGKIIPVETASLLGSSTIGHGKTNACSQP